MYKGWWLVWLRPALQDPRPGTCLGCKSRLWRRVRRNNVRSDPPRLQKPQMSDQNIGYARPAASVMPAAPTEVTEHKLLPCDGNI